MSMDVDILDERASFLSGRQRNVFSQFGEDGLIEAALARFGITNKWCFEVGAHNGEWYSNTKVLRDQGWSALLIECEENAFGQLVRFSNDRVFCVREKIGIDSLDRLLSDAAAPADVDFGVIDIDGQDYWVWDGLRRFAPRLMLVEFSRASEEDIPPLGDTGIRQATLNPILKLGESKGYVALCKTFVNVLFAKRELL